MQHDGDTVLVEDMHKSELHSITAEPTKLDKNSTNEVQLMEDMGKACEHEVLGECLLDQYQCELSSLAIESEIQSHGYLMVSIDDKVKGIKANDKDLCTKNKFDVLNQGIEYENSGNAESNRNKDESNANNDIVVEYSTTTKDKDAPLNNEAYIGVIDYVIDESVNNKRIKEEDIVETGGGIEKNVWGDVVKDKEASAVNNVHEVNKKIIEQQSHESIIDSEKKEDDTKT
ncbi:hypothetical protein K7X08_015034 [Anisodus acutangulus]|uniref:Uncharacterized protein n=1 Tax=Anisodus acutangulus TaxID=402998 RepID=A0A9Q1L5Y9_9SOLA|nr:hypothetical protein K7X08_015034 [Anisodus acutangulus]